MEFLNNSSTVLLFSFTLLLLVVVIVLLLKYFKILKEKDDKIIEMSFNFEILIKEMQEEINRQNFVIKTYQDKFILKGTNLQEKGQTNTKNKELETEISDIMFQKNQLEKEKQQFKDKTKKLWEQSIAIHKEKDRIDALKKNIEKNHKEVTDSIRYAKNIQNALLPLQDYLKTVLPEHFILYKPRDIVSGDFYWTKLIENQLIIVAADCTGHGVPGAFMSMLGISSLNEIVIHTKKADAANILEELRKKVINSLHQEDTKLKSRDGMDAAVCVFNKDAYTLQYAGAYNPLYLYKDNELFEYKATACPVAYFIKMREFENHNIILQPGNIAYIFSDGFVDQFGGPDGSKFKSKNFKNLLLQLSTQEESMKNIGDKLELTFTNWKGERYEQLDDILVMGIKF